MTEEDTCLDRHTGECEGPVQRRRALSATGVRHPRCERHWVRRVDEHERHLVIYPDSPVPPAWFDPAAAGETWDED